MINLDNTTKVTADATYVYVDVEGNLAVLDEQEVVSLASYLHGWLAGVGYAKD
jgi:hypothetical protein